MTSKRILLIIPIIFSLFLIPNLVMTYADHDEPSGGSGCSGDCTPPTMGINSEGINDIKNGFSINGKATDVEYFKQNIETQTINVGEQVEIILKVYENSGTSYLQHVGLFLGVESIFKGSVWVDSSPVEMHWDQTFNGVQSVTVIENVDNLISNANVEVEVDDKLTILKFQFTPTKSFDTSKIVVKMWDQKRSAWTNTFFDALEIIEEHEPEVVLNDETHEEESHETHEEESHETHEEESHETHEDFHCRAGLEKVLRASTLTPVCVTSYSASVLIDFGWAVPAH